MRISGLLRTSFRTLTTVVMIGALAAAATPATRGVPFHTKLLKSAPAANDTLTAAPTAISLWFNEKVELKVTTVKLAGPAGAVKLAGVTRDDKVKDAPVVAAITTPLAAGSYTASWSVAGDDGHPVKGSFAFVVKGGK